MWIVAGVLLGLVCLATVIGFHSGPHAHAVAGILGTLGAGWLVFMMVAGGPGPVLWSLLGADVVLGVGVGATAWKGLSEDTGDREGIRRNSLEGAEGVAMGDLTPEGIVRVRGELWSAVSLNGTVADATPVQVLRVAGVRLEVWGEHAEAGSTERLFDLEEVSLDHVRSVRPIRADHGGRERGVQ